MLLPDTFPVERVVCAPGEHSDHGTIRWDSHTKERWGRRCEEQTTFLLEVGDERGSTVGQVFDEGKTDETRQGGTGLRERGRQDLGAVVKVHISSFNSLIAKTERKLATQYGDCVLYTPYCGVRSVVREASVKSFPHRHLPPSNSLGRSPTQSGPRPAHRASSAVRPPACSRCPETSSSVTCCRENLIATVAVSIIGSNASPGSRGKFRRPGRVYKTKKRRTSGHHWTSQTSATSLRVLSAN
ncbi:hypothetical protein BaRGS_00036580 [Batillaria attramentaria]|uniref:Uncharacterized protein n=1 Tax=Batillaria attramentaria TaxID=370345 RepID=A0ABD0JBX0_9CAEN